MLRRLDGVNIGAEEQEFPTILALLMLDHLFNTGAIIETACIFHSIRRDNKQGVRWNIFLSRILVDVADVVDCASNRIQQGGAAAHTILPISHGLDVSDIDAVMDHFADIVKEDSGDQRFAGSFLLLFNHGVEAADCVGLKSTHGTAAVKDKDDLSQILIHCKYLQ